MRFVCALGFDTAERFARRLLNQRGSAQREGWLPLLNCRIFDGPRVRLFESSQDAHKGSLATAVGADESDALVALSHADAERDVLKDGLDAVGFLKVVCGKRGNL